MAKKDYKCGPNFLPKWVFNEPLFERCCVKHDRSYVKQVGKWSADIAFLKCTWKKSKGEKSFWWRMRNFTQSILLFLLVVLLPYSYISYLLCKFKNK